MNKEKKVLGRPAHTGLSSPKDFKGIIDVMKFIYRDFWGYAIVAKETEEKKWKQRPFIPKRDKWEEVEQFLDPQQDSFTSVNLMYTGRKGNNRLAKICAAYVDVDCRKVNLMPDKAWEIIKRDYIREKVPPPSLVVMSGRGLHLYWLLAEHPKALPRWNMVEDRLVEIFKPLGADSSATDAARVLRLAFTVNTKCGKMAEIIAVNDIVYTISELLSALDIKRLDLSAQEATLPATKKQIEWATYIAQQLGIPVPDFNNRYETAMFIKNNKDRVPCRKHKKTFQGEDFSLRRQIDALIALVPFRTGVDCKRELILFMLRGLIAMETGDYEYALKKTLEVNRMFKHRLDEKEVIRTTASAEKKLKEGKGYRFKLSTMIDRLDITEEEKNAIPYFRSPGTLTRKERNRAAHLARLRKQGKRTKTEQVKERRKDIEKLLSEGVSHAEIREKLKISERTLGYDIAAIKEERIALDNAEISDRKSVQTPANTPTQKKTKIQKTKSHEKAAVKAGKKMPKGDFENLPSKVQKALLRSKMRAEKKAQTEAKIERELKIIGELIDQGLSRAAICRELGICATSLRSKINRLGEEKWNNDNAVVIDFGDDKPFVNVISRWNTCQNVDTSQSDPSSPKPDRNVLPEGSPGKPQFPYWDTPDSPA